jgi:hypothetical protein
VGAGVGSPVDALQAAALSSATIAQIAFVFDVIMLAPPVDWRLPLHGRHVRVPRGNLTGRRAGALVRISCPRASPQQAPHTGSSARLLIAAAKAMHAKVDVIRA